MLKFLIAFLCFISGSLAVADDFRDYRLVDIQFSAKDRGITRTLMRFQVGPNPLNQFNVTHVVRLQLPSQVIGPVLLVAPLGVDARDYERNTTGAYSQSFMGNLALERFDVWAVDDRITMLPRPEGADFSVMQTWDTSARVRDIEFTRQLIKSIHRSTNPVLVAEVGGGVAAIAAINAYPDHYQGIYAGSSPYSADPAVQAYNRPYCDALNAQLAQGIYIEEAFSDLVPLVHGARDFPNDPAPPIPGFPPGLTNKQLFVLLASTPAILGSHAYGPGYYYAAGNVAQGTFTHLNEAEFFEKFDLLPALNSTAAHRDFHCGLAGDTHFVDQLSSFKGHAFFQSSGGGSGPFLVDTAKLLTQAASVHVNVIPGRGEGDYYITADRRALIDIPLVAWLKQVF